MVYHFIKGRYMSIQQVLDRDESIQPALVLGFFWIRPVSVKMDMEVPINPCMI